MFLLFGGSGKRQASGRQAPSKRRQAPASARQAPGKRPASDRHDVQFYKPLSMFGPAVFFVITSMIKVKQLK
jgi:hypothetical protein